MGLYINFSRREWACYIQDAAVILNEADLASLKEQSQPLSLDEVTRIYLPLSRLLSRHVEAMQSLHRVTGALLNNLVPKVPYVIAVTGSVAVGKSTLSRVLQTLLQRYSHHPQVDLISTDGYLYPHAVLEEQGLINRRGFPETYDLKGLANFLAALKAGKPHLKVPVFSHRLKDIVPNASKSVNQPDILIIEGLNLLNIAFISDFFDFSLYVDADTDWIKAWYLERFMCLFEKAKKDKTAYLHPFTQGCTVEARQMGESIWHEVNEANLLRNVLPYRKRAKLILRKGEGHRVEQILLRKI